MCVVLYANGLSEEQKPLSHTFTDEELLRHFSDFDTIRTHRLSEVPNVWCVWGENDPIDKRSDEYNQIASSFIDNEIYSPVFFIHDTEIDPSWKLTDDIIQFGYTKFKKEILGALDTVAVIILEEQEKQRESSGASSNNLIFLEQTGISIDKRIVYKFDMEKQNEDLFKPTNFLEFSKKMHHFLKNFYADGEIFVIYADKNVLIELQDNHVKPLIDKVINTLQLEEEYEMCSDLKDIYDRWSSYKNNLENPVTKQRKKRTRKPSQGPKNSTEQK